MNRSLKLQVEMLEGRVLMDAAGSAGLALVASDPAGPGAAEVAVLASVPSADAASNTLMVGERPPSREGSARPLPVLMVIANQDFYQGWGAWELSLAKPLNRGDVGTRGGNLQIADLTSVAIDPAAIEIALSSNGAAP
jgi:hypothetical protein